MKKLAFAFLSMFVPVLALAQATNVQPLITFVTDIQTLVQYTIPIAVALAVLFFFWGLAQYILSSGDEAARKDGRGKMLWGVIALFVIVSIWGIVGFIGGILGIGQGGTAPVPGVNLQTGGGGTSPTQIQPK